MSGGKRDVGPNWSYLAETPNVFSPGEKGSSARKRKKMFTHLISILEKERSPCNHHIKPKGLSAKKKRHSLRERKGKKNTFNKKNS